MEPEEVERWQDLKDWQAEGLEAWEGESLSEERYSEELSLQYASQFFLSPVSSSCPGSGKSSVPAMYLSSPAVSPLPLLST